MTKNKKKLTKILSNDWIITLTATLVGVFAALYLNEIVISRKRDNKIAIAKKNVFKEFNQNQENLEKNIYNLETVLGVTQFINPKMDNEGNFITSPDSIANFKSKYPSILKISDSVKLNNGNYKYKGEVNVDFNLTHINLTNFAIKTLKSSGLSTDFDFDCLVNLERAERFTDESIEKEKRILEKLYKTIETKKTEDFIKYVKQMIQIEKWLLEFYTNGEQNLKNCS